MDSIERLLAKAEAESKALDVAHDRSAANLPVFTNQTTHATTQNKITVVSYGSSSDSGDPERVFVTFDTDTGANTVAKLEVITDGSASTIVRRSPYSGGAKWSVTAPAKGNWDGTGWSATNYTFVVQSMLDGTVSAAGATS